MDTLVLQFIDKCKHIKIGRGELLDVCHFLLNRYIDLRAYQTHVLVPAIGIVDSSVVGNMYIRNSINKEKQDNGELILISDLMRVLGH